MASFKIVFVRYYHWVSGLIFQNEEKATTRRELFSNLCGIRSKYKGYFVTDMNKDRALRSGRAVLAIEFIDRIPWSCTYAVPRLIFDNHTMQRNSRCRSFPIGQAWIIAQKDVFDGKNATYQMAPDEKLGFAAG